MTDNSLTILNYLKGHYGKEFNKYELVESLGVSLPAVNGSVTALVKKGCVEKTRTEVVEDAPATETRKAKTRNVNYYMLTEAGLAYDPVAEEEAKAAEKAAAKAAKAAAKEQ